MQHSNSSRTHRATIQRLVSPPVRHITAPPPSLYSSSHSPHPTSNLSSPSTSDPVTVMGLYAAFADAIDAYTGLSPAAFFTIGAIMVGTYRLVSGMFVAPDSATERALAPAAEPPAPPAKPVQLGEVTLEELRAYDGSDPKKPLLIAIKGQIYDVSMSRMFYGPGGPYALFAGHDASRALALMSFDRNDLTSNLDGLRQADLEVLQDWEYKFMEKYVKVGQVVSEKTTNGEETVSNEKAEEGSELKNGEETVSNEKAEGVSELHQKEAQSDVINKGTEVGAEKN